MFSAAPSSASAPGTARLSCASIASPGSTAITRTPVWTRARVSFPVPAPTSSTLRPARSPSSCAIHSTAPCGYSGRARSYRLATSSNGRESGCWSSDTRRWTEGVDDAVLAPWQAGDADAPAVPDQQVRKAAPVLARDEANEVPLDLHRIFVAREAEALRETANVSVDNDPLSLAELGGDDVGGLACDTWEVDQLLEPPRHLAVELLQQHLHRPAQRLRLLTEEAGREDVALELFGRNSQVVLRAPVLLEQPLGDAVHVDVRRLRGEHHRDEELEIRPRLEGDGRVGVRGGEAFDDRPDACALRADAPARLLEIAAGQLVPLPVMLPSFWVASTKPEAGKYYW